MALRFMMLASMMMPLDTVAIVRPFWRQPPGFRALLPVDPTGVVLAGNRSAGVGQYLQRRSALPPVPLPHGWATMESRHNTLAKRTCKMATLANVAVIFLEILGLRISISSRGWQIFAYYTQTSNLITLASSVAFLLVGASAAPLRHLSSCMLAMTFLVTLFILVPMGGGFKNLMLLGNGLYHHTLCPIVSIASYVLWEPHGGSWLLPAAVTTVYGLTMLYLNWKRSFDGPYPFFRVHEQSVAASIGWTLALIALITVISLGMSWIAR